MNRIILISIFSILTFNVMAQEKIVQTAGRDQLGEFAPQVCGAQRRCPFRRSMEPHGQARSARPQSGNDYLAYQSGYYGQLARLPSSVGKKERYHPHRDSRDYHPYRFLRRLAEGMGGIQSGQGRVGRELGRRRCQGRFPARDDLSHRRAQYGLCAVFHRQ